MRQKPWWPYSCGSSGHTLRPVNITVTFVLSALGGFLVLPTAVLCWPGCQGFLVWLECRGPFQKGRTGKEHRPWMTTHSFPVWAAGSGEGSAGLRLAGVKN